MNALHTLIEKFNTVATETSSQAEKGHRFEVLIQRYLETEPIAKERFEHVWLWNDWPYRGHSHDVGIDLVAQERGTGKSYAIQCKCYHKEHKLVLGDVSTFFTQLNRKWKNISFAGGILIATAYERDETLCRTMRELEKPCEFIGLSDLETAAVDWAKLAEGKAASLPKYDARPHQREAIDAVLEGFKEADRGKLIMACGTGKTFTALRLAEEYTQGKGCVLFLAPSIALVSQSLREWMSQTVYPMHPIAVCSDAQAGRADDLANLSALDLPSPASTNPVTIGENYAKFHDSHLTVIFSTYQSLDKVHEAQAAGALPTFDLTICDEAHRTTGVSLTDKDSGELDESLFVKVHDANYIQSIKRLYMTATPRIYSDAARQQAADGNAEIASMDDATKYGKEFFRLSFDRAVNEGLLTDYKVLILCVDELYAEHLWKQMPATEDGQLMLDDVVKMVGCYNGLRKHVMGETPQEEKPGEYDPSAPDGQTAYEDTLQSDPEPMQRAVSFAENIKDSQKKVKAWDAMLSLIATMEKEQDILPSQMKHVDGAMDMNKRGEALQWLKDDTHGECRILSNVRCLSEGVDVPALDAVMFLSPRRSQVDVVQSVGRVMRRAEGKKYGYIILPIGIPNGVKPEDVLDSDPKYGVIWDVLQALRAHDNRFNAEINSINLNKGRSQRIKAVGVGFPRPTGENGDEPPTGGGVQLELPLNWEQRLEDWHDAILARTVKKCGERTYWEQWARDIADIARRQQEAIEGMLNKGIGAEEFQDFIEGLKENTRPDISRADAIEMLSQQMICRPVFNALFPQYEFAEKNPVSATMNAMLDIIQEETPVADREHLQKFYESVHTRAKSIDNAAGRQTVIKELYEKFFKEAFKKTAKEMGIVYTPVEVVDFIIHSVHEILKKEFGQVKGIGSEGVRILDPFTGTGTFIVRAIQSGLIAKEDLPRKYKEELFAAEIVLLAYYTACVNIESAYHGIMGQAEYDPFGGICLTDTFMMHENSAKDEDLFTQFEENGERVKRLCAQDIRVIIGNPPYSDEKKKSDDGLRRKYPKMDARIAETYASQGSSTLMKGLYNSCVYAMRWASDCIKDNGVLAFVTEGAFIDSKAFVGFRKTLMKECSTIYCLNLRGNQRTSGELSRQEGGKIFDSGSRAPIAIIILVKKSNHEEEKDATLYYHDIGDYLTRCDKLNILKEKRDISNINWEKLTPDGHGDWVNHRVEEFSRFLLMGDEKTKGKQETKAIFYKYALGVSTNRNAWVYNFSRKQLGHNIEAMIAQYESDRGQGTETNDPRKIKYTDKLRDYLRHSKTINFEPTCIRLAQFRPYQKQHLYYSKDLNERPGNFKEFMPTDEHKNILIQISGKSSSKPFSCIVNSGLVDMEQVSKGQCFPLYWFEKKESNQQEFDLDDNVIKDGYIRHDGITDYALNEFISAYNGINITKEDIFYYVYGLLHSPEYCSKYENNLRKEMVRIPFCKDFKAFSDAGRKLADLHLNYESVEPWPVEVNGRGEYSVKKMRFKQKGIRHTIQYNDTITISGIPEEAYEYIVNGKSAIEWVMEEYAVDVDKHTSKNPMGSDIVNDPNEWCKEHQNPRYIIDLLARVIRVSMETVAIVKALPPMGI